MGLKQLLDHHLLDNFKEKRKDIGWDYGIPIPENIDHVKYSFCDTIYKGGIIRLKNHLIGNNKNVAACKRCPAHVKERVEENWKQKLEEKQAPNQVNQVDVFIIDDEELK
ncbi:hypothetical protein LIER_33843 [Lithospermum erythrorhizon]|uniref:Uncharacterized protein n=1 Tax=Lithospermum erythrorhizon TaxID=34254 RepID=A0AAV3S113_LITER